MHKVQVAHGGVDEGLVGRGADALYDAGAHHAVVVLVHGAAPGRAADEDEEADDKCMALAPDAAGGDEKGARGSDAEEEIAGQDRYLRQVLAEPQRQRDCVGCQDGAEGCCEAGCAKTEWVGD